MILSLFFVFSFEVVVGLDIGHANIKAGMGKFNGVTAVNNEQSKKLSPSYFAIWNYTNPKNTRPKNKHHFYMYELEDLTWDFTSRAQTHAKRFPQNAMKGFYPLLNTSNGLSHREALALTLRYLLSTIDSGAYTPEKTVLSLAVEPFLSRHERFALKEVARLANTSLAYIIESPIAVADYYVISKNKRLQQDIAFIDIGASGTWISIFSFTSMGKTDVVMNQKAILHNSTLGGDYIDQIIGNYLYNRFVEEINKSDLPLDEKTLKEIRTSQKIKNKFYETGKLVKERLSINKNFPVNMEDIVQDLSLQYDFTREEFNELIQPFTDSLYNLINESMTIAKVKEIQHVEVIGGNSRPQIIHDIIKNLTKVHHISHTLNPEEAIILGTTLLGSTKSSSYKLPKKIKASTFANTHVEIEVEGKLQTIYSKRDRVEKPKFKHFTALELLNEKVKMYTDEDHERPFDIFTVSIPDDTPDNAEVSLKFAFDEYTLPYLVNAECNNEKLPVTHFTPDWQLDNETFNKSFEFVMTMDEIQNDRKNSSATRNQLEQFVYDMYKKVFENYDNFTDFMRDNETEPFKKAIQENQKWLDSLTKPFMSSKVFQKRLKDLKDLTNDAELRYEDWQRIMPYIDMLNQTIVKAKEWMENEPKKKPWLLWPGCQRTMDNLRESYDKSVKFLNDCLVNYTTMDKSHSEESETNFENIDIKRQILELNLNSSMKLKKPTPTPRPSPTPPGWTPRPPTPTPEPNAPQPVNLIHYHDPDVPEYPHQQFMNKEFDEKIDKYDIGKILFFVNKDTQIKERIVIDSYYRALKDSKLKREEEAKAKSKSEENLSNQETNITNNENETETQNIKDDKPLENQPQTQNKETDESL